MNVKQSTKVHWEKFWENRTDIDQVYSNEDRIYKNLASITPISAKKILEVGSGSSRDSLQLASAGAQVFVLDYSSKSLEISYQLAQNNGQQINCIQADALQMPVADETFDIVFHQGLLEHFRDPMPILQENYRVLKPNGLLLVDVPQRYHIYTAIKHILILLNKWFAGWETEFSIRELRQLLKQTGFVIKTEYGNWMRPSLLYRIIREICKKIGLKLPLYPGGFKSIGTIRDKIRKQVSAQRWAFYTFLDIGVIGQKNNMGK
ncbi:MAG TPA: class I SAM-dependent methyltransferase [bacterium]|nr:class I SAM-dependent methyltransferase [bacterium]